VDLYLYQAVLLIRGLWTRQAGSGGKKIAPSAGAEGLAAVLTDHLLTGRHLVFLCGGVFAGKAGAGGE
jgi:hypothetical protein